jgi:hypothetical protein
MMADEPFAKVGVSPIHTKTGKLQRAVLLVLERDRDDSMLPTSIRFIFYELEQDGTISKVRTGARSGRDT